MSESHHETKSGPFELIFNNLPVRTVLGLVLMFGGSYVSKNYQEVFEQISHQYGVPVDLGKTVATFGVFLIIFPLVNIFFIKPLADAIGERNSTLEQTFGEAEDLKVQMQKMRSEYEARLVETEADARQKIEAQIKEAQALRQTLMSEAAQRADELVARATQEIEAERNRVLTSIRTQVVDLALSAAEKVIAENMNTERNRKLVEDFISQVEVAR